MSDTECEGTGIAMGQTDAEVQAMMGEVAGLAIEYLGEHPERLEGALLVCALASMLARDFYEDFYAVMTGQGHNEECAGEHATQLATLVTTYVTDAVSDRLKGVLPLETLAWAYVGSTDIANRVKFVAEPVER